VATSRAFNAACRLGTERHGLPGLPDDVLAPLRVDLWFQVMRRQAFPLAWQAWHPT
jgi:hypothetical protein